MRVCKFGGTSMASGDAIRRVMSVLGADISRRFTVVSAPGKRDKTDFKVTDALYDCYAAIDSPAFEGAYKKVAERFEEIARDLGLTLDVDTLLAQAKADVLTAKERDFTASRGEYICAKILANALGVEFVDAAELVKFNRDGELLLDDSLSLIKKRLAGLDRAVIPGFYGVDEDGKIRTFSRGGSDISGALVASALGADVYENWTDVDGFLAADPRIVKSPRVIDCLSYDELRELSYMGAEVLHPESIFPVRRADIPINIKNTFNPSAAGTMIAPSAKYLCDDSVITGIAGKKGFSIINISKEMMNGEIGFARRVLSVFESEGISFEHMPSGIDALSVVVRNEYLDGKLPSLLAGLWRSLSADSIDVQSGLSLIATVGHNMASRQGTAAKLFAALARRHINVRMIDQGSSELNIIVAVDDYDYEKAINAIYEEYFGNAHP